MGRGQLAVTQALEGIRRQLPFKLLGIHPDCGSEFINAHLLGYCQEHEIALTRSRPEHKNDNCHVEQKNFRSGAPADRLPKTRHPLTAGLAG